MHLKACHTLTNRNRSEIAHDTMERNLQSILNCPILADVQKYVGEDGKEYYDFAGHTMEPMPDPEHDGETRMNYIERVVGVVPANAKVELRKEYNDSREYLHTDGLIFEEHGNLTASILRRRKEVACSVEIAVEKMHYDLARNVLVIDEFQFLGVTLLGKEVQPGMEGSMAYTTFEDLTQHSETFTAALQPLVAQMERLQTLVASALHKEGGNTMILNELLQKYNVALEDVPFDYADMNDDQLAEAFAATFDAEDDDTEDGSDHSGSEGNDGDSTESAGQGGTELTEPTEPDVGGESGEGGEDGSDPDTDDGDGEDGEGEPGTGDGDDDEDDEETPPEPKPLPTDDEQEAPRRTRRYQYDPERSVMQVSFEVSCDDLMRALYQALNDAEENYCYISETYLDTREVVYSYWDDDSKQGYRKRPYVFDGSKVTLGEPTDVKARYLTADEWDVIDQIRANYDDLRTELRAYRDRDEAEQKAALLASTDYALIANTDEFKALDVAQFSVDELRDKLDKMLLAVVKRQNYAKNPAGIQSTKYSFINMFGASTTSSSSDFLAKLAEQSHVAGK